MQTVPHVAKQDPTPTSPQPPNVSVTGRHLAVTAAINDYATRRVENLHLDYPKIVSAHVILDVEKFRYRAEVVLNCSNHITIEASEECDDLYAAIDGVISKIARRMRKFKTRFLRSHRPRRYDRVHFVKEQVIPADEFAALDSRFENALNGTYQNGHAAVVAAPTAPLEPARETVTTSAPVAPRPAVHPQPFAVKPMFVDEAALQLDMTEAQQFLVFRNAGDGKVNVLYRRKSGDYGLIEPAEV